MNVKFDTKRAAFDAATLAHREKRIALGKDPDIASDGTPYIPVQSGELVEGRTGKDSEIGEPTGAWLWIPENDTDIKPKDLTKVVAEPGDEFRNRRQNGRTLNITKR